MTALAANVNRPLTDDAQFEDDCAASVHVFCGALVSLDSSGNARPARATNTDHVRGVAYVECDNSSGSVGDKRVKSRAGCFAFKNSAGGDEITKTEYDETCYVVDDQTVAKTSDSGARPAAGRVVRVEGGLVHVQVGQVRGADGDLVAANNLSDVSSAATARSNIGADKGEFMCFLASLLAGTYYFPLPDKVITITKLRSTINQALAGADLTITPSINTTAITGGVITVTQAGSAAGDQDEASPSADNVTDGADDSLRLVLAGNTGAGTGAVVVEYTY